MCVQVDVGLVLATDEFGVAAPGFAAFAVAVLAPVVGLVADLLAVAVLEPVVLEVVLEVVVLLIFVVLTLVVRLMNTLFTTTVLLPHPGLHPHPPQPTPQVGPK